VRTEELIQKKGHTHTLNVTINPKTLNVCTVLFDQPKHFHCSWRVFLESRLWRVFEGHSFPLL